MTNYVYHQLLIIKFSHQVNTEPYQLTERHAPRDLMSCHLVNQCALPSVNQPPHSLDTNTCLVKIVLGNVT